MKDETRKKVVEQGQRMMDVLEKCLKDIPDTEKAAVAHAWESMADRVMNTANMNDNS